MNLTKDELTRVQFALQAVGHDPGAKDGLWGKNTKRALLAWADDVTKAKLVDRPITIVSPVPGTIPFPATLADGGFDEASLKRLSQAHPSLQALMLEARKRIPFKVLDSQRDKKAQEAAFKAGNSKAHFGQSAHNYSPAVALDIAPIPLDWDDRQSFIDISRVILPLAKSMNIPIRWGGDWDMRGATDGWDLPHYELHPWREYAAKSKLYEGMTMLRALSIAAFLSLAPLTVAAQDNLATQVAETVEQASTPLAIDPAVVVTQTPEGDTVVAVPVGNWIGELLQWARDIAITGAVVAFTWLARKLPQTLVNKFLLERAEQLLVRAVDYGINATAGATKGLTLDVNVGSAVVANALDYALEHGPGKIIAWMGGANLIKQKIIARIPLDSVATAEKVAAAVEAKR